MSTYIYNSTEVDCFIAGMPIKRGRADGDFLKIEQVGDDSVETIGADGDVCVSMTNDDRATVTIILMQSSPENDVLSSLRRSQKLGQSGAGIGALLVKDRSGRAVFKANACWIVKGPARAFGKQGGTREWTFRVSKLDATDGGNKPLGV